MEDWWKRKIIRANKLRKRGRLERELKVVNNEINELEMQIKNE